MSVCVVTGAASGIGAAVAKTLRGQGIEVIGIDRRESELCSDLGNPDGRRVAVQEARRRSGDCIDHVVCCAGLGPSEDPFLVASVNYFGAIEILDGLLPALSRGCGSSAVVIGSNEASMWSWQDNTMPLSFLEEGESRVHDRLRRVSHGEVSRLSYASSKQALTVAIRRRVEAWAAHGVRINVVAPGAVQTPMLEASEADPRYSEAVKKFVAPLGRRAQPQEIASVVAFLLGEKASFIHGSVIFVDGGIDARFRPDRF